MDGSGHIARFISFKYKSREVEDLRRQRVETSVELRKQKKQEKLLKRRYGDVVEKPTTPLKEQEMNVASSLSEIIFGMISSDHNLNTKATECLRKILSKDEPPIDEVIEAGLVKLLVKFLGYEDRYTLQCEAAWALTNITSGTPEHTKVVVDAGTVPEFIRLLDSPFNSVVEQCVWGLGNIAGDGAGQRDNIIKSGIVEPLLRVIDKNRQESNPDVLHTVAWTISNLFRYKSPPPPMNTIQLFLPSLKFLMHTDNVVLLDICWALSYATDGNSDNIQLVVECHEILARLVELLSSSHPGIVSGALRTLGNIVAGNDSQAQAVIKFNLLHKMPPLLQHSEVKIKVAACWVLSNITAGSTEQIQAVIDCKLLPLLVAVLTEGNLDSQKEASWVFTNLAARGTPEQIDYIIDTGALKPLCDLLTTKDPALLFILLDGIYGILTAAKKISRLVPVSLLLEETGGCDIIEHLQDHNNDHISKKAEEIIEFFTIEWVNQQSESINRNQYQFNVGGGDAARGFQF